MYVRYMDCIATSDKYVKCISNFKYGLRCKRQHVCLYLCSYVPHIRAKSEWLQQPSTGYTV